MSPPEFIEDECDLPDYETITGHEQRQQCDICAEWTSPEMTRRRHKRARDAGRPLNVWDGFPVHAHIRPTSDWLFRWDVRIIDISPLAYSTYGFPRPTLAGAKRKAQRQIARAKRARRSRSRAIVEQVTVKP